MQQGSIVRRQEGHGAGLAKSVRKRADNMMSWKALGLRSATGECNHAGLVAVLGLAVSGREWDAASNGDDEARREVEWCGEVGRAMWGMDHASADVKW